MIVDFFCLQFLDFTTTDGSHIDGVNAWYLSPDQNNDHIIGTRPQKKFFNKEFKDVFKSGGKGKYDVITDLSGRVSSVKKVI